MKLDLWHHLGARYGAMYEHESLNPTNTITELSLGFYDRLAMMKEEYGIPTAEEELSFKKGWQTGIVGYNVEEIRSLTKYLLPTSIEGMANEIRSIVYKYWEVYCKYPDSDCVDT